MMKVTVTEKTIEFEGFVQKPTHIDADQIMACLSQELGHKYGAVKLSGYWVIGDMTGQWRRISPDPLRRDFWKALADAFSKTIIRK